MNVPQQLLARLLVHNKLLSESQCKKLFTQVPEPENAINRLIKAGHLNERVGTQLLEMFQQKLSAWEKEQAEQAAAGQPEADDEELRLADEPASDSAAETRIVQQTEAEQSAEQPQEKTVPATPKSSGGARADVPPGTAGKELIHSILRAAREAGASDVHINAGLPPVLRINARLEDMDMPPLDPEVCRESLLSILSDEKRAFFLENKDYDFCYDGGEELGRFRTNFLMEQGGMDGVFRLISPTIPALEELGMPLTVEKFTTYAVGIVLITGPKSCGKTTTMASMIDLINRKRSEHVITIEDPIEFVHPCKVGHINQREVGTHTKSFGNALRAALREAPDVIMVGEMRDLETTSLAVSAAETGHLVLATLHTPDAIRTIGRVLDVFPAKEQGQIRAMLSESLRGVVSQQLVPSKDGSTMHLALEILVNNSAIGNMIREDRTFQLRGMMQTGKRLGMVLMDDSLVRLVREGHVTVDEAMIRASDSAYVEKELKAQAAAAAQAEKAKGKSKAKAS